MSKLSEQAIAKREGAETTKTAIALVDTSDGRTGYNAAELFEGLEVAKRLTKPVLEQEIGTAMYVRIMSPAHYGDNNGETDDDGKPRKPPKMFEVVDLSTTDPRVKAPFLYTLIANEVLHSEIVRGYADFGYIGKCFRILKHPKEGKKRYFKYEVAEFTSPKLADLPPVVVDLDSYNLVVDTDAASDAVHDDAPEGTATVE